MLESLLEKLERALRCALAPNEKVFVKLRGAYKEALVCTSMRIIILKAGWMTGQIFGTGMFQCPYANVAGAQVNFRLVAGYFEISTGGMQNLPKSFFYTPKSFWNTDRGASAAKAPNCVTISGPRRAEMFRDACTLIMERVSNIRGIGHSSPLGRQSSESKN
jgi:hypothetical protein